MTEEETKKHLYEHDPQFRRLKDKHQQFKDQLGRMDSHSFLTPEQEMEQRVIKKKKLQIKDQMHQIIKTFQCGQVKT
jgi:uncharacterized protein YdcH (DUF465 family)